MSGFQTRFALPPHHHRLAAALLLLARGVPFLYYGEEIGMADFVPQAAADIRDVQGRENYRQAKARGMSEEEALAVGRERSRDKSRAPLCWTSEPGADFSSNEPWIPISPDAETVNIEALKSDPHSLWTFYQQLIHLRSTDPVLAYGEYRELAEQDGLVSFSRV